MHFLGPFPILDSTDPVSETPDYTDATARLSRLPLRQEVAYNGSGVVLPPSSSWSMVSQVPRLNLNADIPPAPVPQDIELLCLLVAKVSAKTDGGTMGILPSIGTNLTGFNEPGAPSGSWASRSNWLELGPQSSYLSLTGVWPVQIRRHTSIRLHYTSSANGQIGYSRMSLIPLSWI